MDKHRLAYIDEEEAERDNFATKFSSDFDVELFHPEVDISEFVEKLLKDNFDAVVTDFLLNEKYTDGITSVSYDGVELVKEIKKHRADFPCFVLTSYDRDAMVEADDVNYIYPKDYIEEDNPSQGNMTLQDRIQFQIDHYNAKICATQKRLHELLNKYDNDGLTEIEENELLRLDSFLESNMCNQIAIPKEKKQKIAMGKIAELIDVTRDLLNKLKGEDTDEKNQA